MIPLQLHIENFMNHSLSDIDFTGFKSALIVAKNKTNERESNGIGKTTVFSAIEYALFGEVPTSVLEKIVRDGESKCLVTFMFELAGEVYRIERGRSRSGKADIVLRQMIDGKLTKISGTRGAEVEKKIAEIIKINHKSFSHSIKFGQADLSGLASAKNADERRKILQEPLALSDYVKLHKIAVEKMRAVKREIDKVEAAISSIGDPTIELQAAEQELKVCTDCLTSREATIQRLSGDIAQRKTIIDDLKKTLTSDDSEVHEKIERLRKRSKELKTQIEAANERVQQSTAVIESNTKQCAQLKVRLQQLLDQEQEFVKNPVREAKAIIADINKVTEDEVTGSKMLARYEVEYDQANRSVPDGNICTHCFQPITEDHRKRCEAEAAKVLAEKSEQISRVTTNLEKCRNKKKRLQEEHKQSTEREVLCGNLFHERERRESEIGILEKQATEAEISLAASVKEAETARGEEREALRTLAGLKESASQSSAADVNKKILSTTDDIRTYERSIENVRGEVSSFQSRHGAALQRQTTANASLVRLASLQNDLKDWRHKLNIHEYVVESFSTGIPTFIIHSVLDELQLEANKWLQRLRPDLELQFDQALEMVFRVFGKVRDYDQLSTGQKVYIALSLKCGLSRVIQRKLGIDIRFMLWDEVDSALDKAGVETLVEVARIMQEEFKVLVITHNDDLKDKFTHAILVEGDGANGATSSVVTSW